MATTTNNGWTTPDDTAYVKDGASAIRTLGSAIDTSVGTGLLAWQDYDSFTLAGTGWTWGSPTKNGRYVQLGKIVHFDYQIVIVGTPTMGTGAPQFGLPVAANTNTPEYTMNMLFSDVSSGISYAGNISIESSAAYGYMATVSGSYIRVQPWTSTVTPAALAAGDIIRITGWYEAA